MAARLEEQRQYQDAAKKVLRIQVATPVLAALYGVYSGLTRDETLAGQSFREGAVRAALAAADELVRKVEEG